MFVCFWGIVSLELSITRTHAAGGSATDTLTEALRKVKLLDKNYGTMFTDCSLVDFQLIFVKLIFFFKIVNTWMRLILILMN